MNEVRGWLLDLYAAGEEGLVLWVLCENGNRRRLFHHFPITFYAAGPAERLRQAWQFLEKHNVEKTLAWTERFDLFSGPREVLAVCVANPAQQPKCFHDLWRRFPDLVYYNSDIPLAVRYAAAFDCFPLARCRFAIDEADRVQAIETLDSPWDLEPERPPLRILRIEPDVDPQHAAPRVVTIHRPPSTGSGGMVGELVEPSAGSGQAGSGGGAVRIPVRPFRGLLLSIRANIQRYDTDLILTRRGDTLSLIHI